jgi:hypothetical protein
VTGEDRRRDVLGHLQAAAQELIAAAREALDVADEVVSDRIRLMTLLVGRSVGPEQPGPPPVERIEVEKPDG